MTIWAVSCEHEVSEYDIYHMQLSGQCPVNLKAVSMILTTWDYWAVSCESEGSQCDTDHVTHRVLVGLFTLVGLLQYGC